MSDQPHASAASTLRKDPEHPLNKRPDVPRAGLMFWIERMSLASAKNKPHMAQHQDYHYTDWDAIGSNIPYCACQLRFHLQLCWGCIRFKAKLYSVIYINYKARFHMQICWGCVSFRTKLYVSFSSKYYCVIHITSCRAAPMQYLSQYWQAQ